MMGDADTDVNPFDGPIRYSVDTSALIDFKALYPFDLFPGMWSFVADLAAASRFLMPEAVEEECRDQELVTLRLLQKSYFTLYQGG